MGLVAIKRSRRIGAFRGYWLAPAAFERKATGASSSRVRSVLQGTRPFVRIGYRGPPCAKSDLDQLPSWASCQAAKANNFRRFGSGL
jgi:hypothetical protein